MKIVYLIGLLYAICSLNSANELEKDYFELYNDCSVYRVFIKDQSDIDTLQLLERRAKQEFDYWTELRLNHWVDIMIKPSMKESFQNVMSKTNMKYEITIKNVGELVKTQISLNNQNKLNKIQKLEDFDYGKYHTLDEINDWMNMIEKTYPKYVTIFNVSKSYEKRDIYAMKISIPTASKKPAIWFDGGIHAREWISPATVIYMANAFVSNYSIDPNVTDILNTFDIYVLPVFNVDGYEYTWAKDRMWRKTRSKTKVPGCYGADPNRNWDSHHCENGASRDPCSDTYCGDHAFSEIEVKLVADFLLKNNDTIHCYINFHSYSQLWMSPWGYSTKLPPDFKVQDTGSVLALRALSKLYGTQYQHGNIASTIYLASGSSVDWTYDTAKMLYSYAVELRDQGQYGFLLPPEQIIPSGLETFEALKALAFFIKSQS